MNAYYIYKHIRLDTDEVFYIGKGKNSRSSQKSGRNKYWHHIVDKVGYKIEIIITGLSRENADTEEIKYIKQFKDLNLCEANLTFGGTGGDVSTLMSEPDKLKWKSNLKKSRNKITNFKELVGPSISKANRGKGNPGWKGYLHTPYGIFETSREAAVKLKISRNTIREKVNKKDLEEWYLKKD